MTRRHFVAALLSSLFAGAAHCAAIIGSSSGSFLDIVGTSYGAKTQVQWDSQSIMQDFHNPSTLTSVALAFNTQTDVLGLAIGRLDWYNSATLLLILADIRANAGPVSRIPEPGTCAMLAMGLAGIALVRRRRERRS